MHKTKHNFLNVTHYAGQRRSGCSLNFRTLNKSNGEKTKKNKTFKKLCLVLCIHYSLFYLHVRIA